MSTTYKQIAFDIDTKIAKQIAGSKYTYMYQTIQTFMTNNNFMHRQGSVYVSTKPISYADVTRLSYTFAQKYPYISKAIRDITVASISQKRMSLNSLFTYTGRADEYTDYYKTHDLQTKTNGLQR